jgi:hypothetical protein
MDNFQQTVDLREQMERRRTPPKKPVSPIEKVYQEETEDKPGGDLKTISRPKAAEPRYGLIKAILFILAAVVIAGTVYYLFFRQPVAPSPTAKSQNWYAVTLKTNDEMYYGQIGDIKMNPIELKTVYESYDQYINRTGKKEKSTSDSSNTLRLVKKNEEPNDPGGNMLVYQTEIKTVDKLTIDSKVLQAILEHESKKD